MGSEKEKRGEGEGEERGEERAHFPRIPLFGRICSSLLEDIASRSSSSLLTTETTCAV